MNSDFKTCFSNDESIGNVRQKLNVTLEYFITKEEQVSSIQFSGIRTTFTGK